MYRRLEIVARFVAAALWGTLCAPAFARPTVTLDDWILTAVRFIEWPSVANTNDSSILLCHPAGQLEGSRLQGQIVRGQRIELLALANELETGPCRAFFSMSSDTSFNQRWLRTFHDRPVLTIGMNADFCLQGGIVCPASARESSAHYALNFARAARSGFRIRSHLPAHDVALLGTPVVTAK